MIELDDSLREEDCDVDYAAELAKRNIKPLKLSNLFNEAITIPAWMAKDKDLSPIAKLVYGYCLPFIEENVHGVETDNDFIADMLGLTEKQVLKALVEILDYIAKNINEGTKAPSTRRLSR